eukprot:GHVU01215082.1.p1 GENE.GHVU01215082.1~~GHVU01215082.1.p1  ORF type:complete len:133 (+),score=8.02 GHVU01215082.1:704-1102(+)
MFAYPPWANGCPAATVLISQVKSGTACFPPSSAGAMSDQHPRLRQDPLLLCSQEPEDRSSIKLSSFNDLLDRSPSLSSFDAGVAMPWRQDGVMAFLQNKVGIKECLMRRIEFTRQVESLNPRSAPAWRVPAK